MYVYQSFEAGLWTVGFYRPDGKFEPESDHASSEEAAERVAWLNGASRSQARPFVLGDVRAPGPPWVSQD